MDFTKLRRARRVTVDLGEIGEMWVEYVPRRWDAAFVEEHNAILADEERAEGVGIERGRERYLYTLARLLVGWDITDDGSPVPVNRQTVEALDDAVLFLIYRTVRADIEAEEHEKNS